MKNKIYWMEIRRMKERKRPKIRMKGERAHTHTHTNTILCMHVCVCGIMFEGWRPHWLARRARRAPQTPRPKKHVGYLSCPYLLPVNGFQWLCLPLHAQQTTECYLTLSLISNFWRTAALRCLQKLWHIWLLHFICSVRISSSSKWHAGASFLATSCVCLKVCFVLLCSRCDWSFDF